MSLSPYKIIGLTGGIATGKSEVSDYLAQKKHCCIYDADLIARDAVAKDSPILIQISKRFGASILSSHGELNRSKLGNIIFQDKTEKAWVESLIHPYVREQFERQIQAFKRSASLTETLSTLCLVVPLLFESKMEALVSEIWVVACSPEQQLERLMVRNSLSQSEAQARIQSQWPLAEKIKRADIVLNNDGDRPKLYAQIDAAIKAPS